MDNSDDFEPEVYNLVFHNNVCHVCKQTENLLRCSKCKTLVYCSKKHQKMDWKFHKEFCYAMTCVRNELRKDSIHTFEDLVEFRNSRGRYLKVVLNRELEPLEFIMCMSLRFCEICLAEDVQLDCPKCRNVFFCSEEHRNACIDHDKDCEELKLCMELTLSLFREGLGNTNFEVSEVPSSVQNLPNNILDLLALYDKNSVSCGHDLTQNILKLKCISPVASILYGLEKCGKLNNRLFHKNGLTIHIVGGDIYEMGLLWKEMCELIFHWITNLTELEYFIVGPELNHSGTTDKFTKQLCDNCKNRNVKVNCTFHTQLYHNIVKHLKKPDVVVCFNSGLHVNSMEFSTESSMEFPMESEKLPEHNWKDSIEFLVKKGVPLILTAYTLNEINDDIEELIEWNKDKKIEVLVKPHKNPFCDKKPLRDLYSQKEPIYYVNGYISVLNET